MDEKEIENAKTALLRMKVESLEDVKSAGRALKEASKNHRTKVAIINKKIAEIDRDIKRCEKGQSPKMSIPVVRRRGRPKGSKNKVVKSPKNTKTLATIILETLQKRGLTLTQIVLAVVKSGYKSKTKDDFSKLVYQGLYKLQQSNKIKKDNNKIYRIVK